MKTPALLAVDCSGVPCSVALGHAGQVIARSSEDGQRQSSKVLAWIDAVMRQAQLTPGRIDGLAVAIGPGGFTGVRLAVAVVQGLALAWARPVLPVSSLAALALASGQAELPVLTLLDARMGEVYAGWFRCNGQGQVQPIGAEQVLRPDSLSRPAGIDAYLVLGSGYAAYRKAIDAALGAPAVIGDCLWPHAEQVLALARQAWPDAAVAAERLEPTYLRNKVALTSAEQAAARG